MWEDRENIYYNKAVTVRRDHESTTERKNNRERVRVRMFQRERVRADFNRERNLQANVYVQYVGGMYVRLGAYHEGCVMERWKNSTMRYVTTERR